MSKVKSSVIIYVSIYVCMEKEWQSTPAFLPRESDREPGGPCLWDCTESDTRLKLNLAAAAALTHASWA